MLQYEHELRRRSQTADRDAQTLLLFKLVYDWDSKKEAINMCGKLRNNSVLLFGMYQFLKINDINGCYYQAEYDQEKSKKRQMALTIFESLQDGNIEECDTHYTWFMLGRYYQGGFTIQKDEREAIKWYKKSADCGNEFASYYLGKIYLDKGDITNARQLFEQSAIKFNRQANRQLGILYSTILKDSFKAYNHFLNTRDLDNECLSHIKDIMLEHNIDWNHQNHHFWSDLQFSIKTTKTQFGQKISSVWNLKFTDQVHMLMMISKYRSYSNIDYMWIFNKLIATVVIKQLSKVW